MQWHCLPQRRCRGNNMPSRGGGAEDGSAGSFGGCVLDFTGRSGCRDRAHALFAIFQGGADEGGEKRMGLERLGLEFGMELAAEEPWVLGRLNDFDVIFVGRAAGDFQAGGNQSFFIFAIKFVAVAVPLADFELAIGPMSERAGFEFAGPRAEAHGAAHFVHAEKFAQFVNDAVGSLRVEFRAVRLLEAGGVAGVFDGGALHAEANAEEGHFVLAGVLNGVNHALNAAFAEAARNENAVIAMKTERGSLR